MLNFIKMDISIVFILTFLFKKGKEKNLWIFKQLRILIALYVCIITNFERETTYCMISYTYKINYTQSQTLYWYYAMILFFYHFIIIYHISFFFIQLRLYFIILRFYYLWKYTCLTCWDVEVHRRMARLPVVRVDGAAQRGDRPALPHVAVVVRDPGALGPWRW